MKQILIVEDEQQIGHFLRRGLTYKGFGVSVVGSGEDALTHISERKPDLIILDVMLPDMSGFELCRHLRSNGYTNLPIIMLTARDELVDKVAGLNSGADDYMTKPFAFEELVARIGAALRRTESRDQQSQRIVVGDLELDPSSRQAWRAGEELILTKREYDLLELLARHAGQVLTKEQIFEYVWGYDSEAGWEVIKVYVNYLRSKLNAGGKPDVIHAVRGIGYMLRTV
ncbi:two-component system response regulator MprA [Thermosporothrix hazakensis]|jgi:DNA-binding response OmpR family regulator|uniref:Two-component system response regulator MprA n=2 Tax=Thermosporothrix TaxID=768650 RepID=A0A326U880_THEHA|nr:response regulator transcription factor [Thermosporothrix hazakensis]PZW30599.1 two-component system response regulator MprA [Thermosporothrix hazakensis]BBH91314.1 response regulator MprA [Thermosporothrix sp. COM3]GCE49461.1 response regulator MprA [Thermosporothrix hazakensis]